MEEPVELPAQRVYGVRCTRAPTVAGGEEGRVQRGWKPCKEALKAERDRPEVENQLL